MHRLAFALACLVPLSTHAEDILYQHGKVYRVERTLVCLKLEDAKRIVDAGTADATEALSTFLVGAKRCLNAPFKGMAIVVAYAPRGTKEGDMKVIVFVSPDDSTKQVFVLTTHAFTMFPGA